MFKTPSVVFWTLLLALLTMLPSANRQQVYGSVYGTVTDQSGAGVPGAKVTISDQDQGTTAVATANEVGNYRQTNLNWWYLAGAAGVVLAGYFQWRAPERTVPGASMRRTFWASFTDGQNPPLVVFSNGAFVGNPVTGMRYMDPAADPGHPVFDHYTGVGEVFAIHELDTLFFSLNRRILP